MSSLSLSFTISRAASPHGFIHSASPHGCLHFNPYILCVTTPLLRFVMTNLSLFGSKYLHSFGSSATLDVSCSL